MERHLEQLIISIVFLIACSWSWVKVWWSGFLVEGLDLVFGSYFGLEIFQQSIHTLNPICNEKKIVLKIYKIDIAAKSNYWRIHSICSWLLENSVEKYTAHVFFKFKLNLFIYRQLAKYAVARWVDKLQFCSAFSIFQFNNLPNILEAPGADRTHNWICLAATINRRFR